MAGNYRVCVLDVDYVTDDERVSIIITGKDEKGRSVAVIDNGFYPYFYVEPKEGLSKGDVERLKERIKSINIEGRRPKSVESVKRNYLGKERQYIKITAELPADLSRFRDVVKEWKEVANEYEYSIPFYRRYLIDKGIFPMEWIEVSGKEVESEWDFESVIVAEGVKPFERESHPEVHVLAFDIETVESEGESVIMISVKDNRGFSRVLTYRGEKGRNIEKLGNEKEMIERFCEIVRKRNPDFIVGYNTDGFDFQKLAESAEKNKTALVLGRDGSHVYFRRRMRASAVRIRGRVHIDLFSFIDKIMRPSLSTEVMTLDRVAKELTGRGKQSMEWRDIEEAWEKGDVKKIASYCLSDSALVMRLADAVLPQIFEICRIVGQSPFDISRMSYSQLVEWLLIRRAYKEGEIVPRRPDYNEIQKRRQYPPYTGGYVLEPKEGIYTNIALFDFRSLYPSIIVTHNISPETLDCMACEECRKEENPNRDPDGRHYYCMNRTGFVPAMIKELLEERIEIKKRMKGMRKSSERYKRLEIRQHVLKVMANASYGYYGYAGSRWYSRMCAQSAASWGRYYIKKVIEMARKKGYEPIYGDTDSLFVQMKNTKEALGFLESVNRTLPGIITLDFQGMYKSGIFVSAKSGSGAKKRYALLDYKGNMVIRGFERVRRDWSLIAKKTQETVLEAILKDRSPEKAIKAVRKTIARLKSGKVKKEELVIYSQITRPLEEYEQIGPHVVAARKAAESGRNIKPGSTISYIITKGTGSISSRAEPAATAGEYDPEYYIENQVIPAALRILSGLGYTAEDIIKGRKASQKSLEGFV